MKFRFTPLQITAHLGSWVPLGWLVWAYFNHHLTVNPIQAAEQHTGQFAIWLLILSLACTPLHILSGYGQLLKLRRPLGMYAFFYACLHFTIFIGIDFGFDWGQLWELLKEKPYIIAGASTLLVLVPLAITSQHWWIRRMGRRWKQLHRLAYLAGGLAILHYSWVVKGTLATLHGAILRPLLYGLLVAFLLVVRVPLVRMAIIRQRMKLRPVVSRLLLHRHPSSSEPIIRHPEN